jgi:hypothetical protein
VIKEHIGVISYGFRSAGSIPKQNPTLGLPGAPNVYSPGGRFCADVTLKEDVPYLVALKGIALSLATVLALVPSELVLAIII